MEHLSIPCKLNVFTVKTSTSCEDPHTQYLDFPDGLRVIYRDGVYAGWYLTGEAPEAKEKENCDTPFERAEEEAPDELRG